MEKRTVITVRELAHVWNLSMPTAYALTEREGFPVVRVGRKKLIPVAELEKWLAEESKRGRAV